jgi:hypothetical protein
MLITPAPIKTNPNRRTTARFSRHQLTILLTRSSSSLRDGGSWSHHDQSGLSNGDRCLALQEALVREHRGLAICGIDDLSTDQPTAWLHGDRNKTAAAGKESAAAVSLWVTFGGSGSGCR